MDMENPIEIFTTVYGYEKKEMANYYIFATDIINGMKCGELLYRYCFYDNFVDSKKLKKLLTRTGDNERKLNYLAHVMRQQMWKDGFMAKFRIKHYQILALLKNEGRKTLTKIKQRMIKGLLMYHCLKIHDDDKCQVCGRDLITIYVSKNFMKMIGKKIPKGRWWETMIVKCGCGEYLKLKQEGIYGNSCTIKL